MKYTRELTTTGMWTVEFGDEDSRASGEKTDVLPRMSQLFGEHRAGRIVVCEDVGGRSWFSRFLGLHPRFLLMRFAIEWSGDVASLIFFDDAVSEYRAKDAERPIPADEVARKAIAHGEPDAHPLDQCMALVRAREAIEEYMRSGTRPGWLQYQYVA